jgi:hypothetical protein
VLIGAAFFNAQRIYSFLGFFSNANHGFMTQG